MTRYRTLEPGYGGKLLLQQSFKRCATLERSLLAPSQALQRSKVEDSMHARKEREIGKTLDDHGRSFVAVKF